MGSSRIRQPPPRASGDEPWTKLEKRISRSGTPRARGCTAGRAVHRAHPPPPPRLRGDEPATDQTDKRVAQGCPADAGMHRMIDGALEPFLHTPAAAGKTTNTERRHASETLLRHHRQASRQGRHPAARPAVPCPRDRGRRTAVRRRENVAERTRSRHSGQAPEREAARRDVAIRATARGTRSRASTPPRRRTSVLGHQDAARRDGCPEGPPPARRHGSGA